MTAPRSRNSWKIHLAMTLSDGNKWISAKEAAALLGMCAGSVRYHVIRRDIDAVQLVANGAVYISVASLRTFAANRQDIYSDSEIEKI